MTVYDKSARWNVIQSLDGTLSINRAGSPKVIPLKEVADMLLLTDEYIKAFDLDGCSVDRLGLFVAQLAALETGYKASGQEAPKWFASKLKVAKRKLTDANRDALEAKLERLETEYERMKPLETRREDTRAEIESVRKALAA